MRVRVCWSKVDEHAIIVMIESSFRLCQATFIALTLPASFPFVKACQHRLLDRNYFRPSSMRLKMTCRSKTCYTARDISAENFTHYICAGILTSLFHRQCCPRGS